MNIMGIEDLDSQNLNTYRPIVIWGTRTAAEICYKVLQKRKMDIAAVGENNAKHWGKKFHGITVLSAEQISAIYHDALIVIGSFRYDITEAIIKGLQQINQEFAFLRFGQIEYIYETECVQRVISNKEKYLSIINNIYKDRECPWNRRTNQYVISEYCYAISDSEADDIKKVLEDVYGIKALYLTVSVDRLNIVVPMLERLTEYENIGHIILVLDRIRAADKETLNGLSGKLFYIICGEEAAAPDTQWRDEEVLCPIEFRELPEELFIDNAVSQKDRVTEETIVQSVMHFVGEDVKQGEPTCKKTKPVHIVQLFNGLANQMLMYLFGRFVEEESGGIVIFDDTILNLDVYDEDENMRRMCQWNKAMSVEEVRDMVAQTREKNSFYQFKRAEIAEVLDIPIRLLSDYFEEEVWRKYLNLIKEKHSRKYAQCFPLGHVLSEAGIDCTIVRDSLMPDEFLAAGHCLNLDTYIFSRPYGHDSVAEYMLHNAKTIYYMGIWATGREKDWLYSNRDWVRKQIDFRVELCDENQAYAIRIQDSDSVVIHIRRGDFVCGRMSADIAYFKKAIRATEKMEDYKDKRYFIFSDDLEWCQSNETPLGIDGIKDRTIYVSGNTGRSSYIDMYLMSLGKISIPTPGSSFGYVAVLVSKTMEKLVDVPRYLYHSQHGIDDAPQFIDLRKVR